MVFEVAGTYEPMDAAGGVPSFTMPAQAGVADLHAEITLDGVHYQPAPTTFTLSAPTALTSLAPAVGSLHGGTTIHIHATNLFDSPDLSVLFVKVRRRIGPPRHLSA